MRLNALPHLITALAALLVMVASSAAQAQAYNSYFIAHGTPNAKDSGLTLWVADCGAKLDLKTSNPQTLSCTLTPVSQKNSCQPCFATDPKSCSTGSVCPFLVNSTDQAPSVLIFGRSSTNPTCGYVYDPVLGRYVYKCW
jgi:hypothetical protein